MLLFWLSVVFFAVFRHQSAAIPVEVFREDFNSTASLNSSIWTISEKTPLEQCFSVASPSVVGGEWLTFPIAGSHSDLACNRSTSPKDKLLSTRIVSSNGANKTFLYGEFEWKVRFPRDDTKQIFSALVLTSRECDQVSLLFPRHRRAPHSFHAGICANGSRSAFMAFSNEQKYLALGDDPEENRIQWGVSEAHRFVVAGTAGQQGSKSLLNVNLGHSRRTYSASAEFHAYRFSWKPDMVVLLIDEVEVWRTDKREVIPQEHLQIAIVSMIFPMPSDLSYAAAENTTDSLPQDFLIDYVAAWQEPDIGS